MENKETLDDALNELKKRGYEADLSFEENTFALYGEELDLRLDPDTFHVDEIDHIENGEPQAEETTVYAISSRTGVKGFMIEKIIHQQHNNHDTDQQTDITGK